MKYLISAILLFTTLSPIFCQIYGNGNIETRTKNVEGLLSIDIQFNANIILDYTQKEIMTINADENILDFIGIDFTEGILTLDQIKWIEPRELPTITIGSPALESVYQGTHSTTIVKNIERKNFLINGNVGMVKVEGTVENLFIDTENTSVDLSKLVVGTIQIGDYCSSEITLNTFEKIIPSEDSEPQIIYLDKTLAPSKKYAEKQESLSAGEVTFIEFKIKNNSFKRNAFYVKGPNGRGGMFSYGFSLFPFTKKNEKWSVGTKVYKESRSGKLEELITITEDMRETTVDLF